MVSCGRLEVERLPGPQAAPRQQRDGGKPPPGEPGVNTRSLLPESICMGGGFSVAFAGTQCGTENPRL